MFIVDSREPADIIALIGETFDAWEKRELDTGDFSNTESTFTAERKTWADFFNSIMDGRYVEQRFRLSLLWGFRAWILEGNGWEFYNSITAKDRSLMNAAIISLSAKYQIQVIYSWSTAHTIQIVRWINAKAGELPSPPPLRNAGRDLDLDESICILMGVNGIGEKTATAIWAHFKSMDDIHLATIQQLMEVDGVGKKTAEKIHSALHRRC